MKQQLADQAHRLAVRTDAALDRAPDPGLLWQLAYIGVGGYLLVALDLLWPLWIFCAAGFYTVAVDAHKENRHLARLEDDLETEDTHS